MFTGITGIIQIGTSTGQEDELFRSISSTQKFVYIEPIPSSFAVLQEKFGQNQNYKLFNSCCGNYNGITTMYLSSNNFESSSVLKPLLHIAEFPTVLFNSIAEFPISKLDSLDINFPDYNLLWIDVQGYEIEVLKGASECLKHIKSIYVECSDDRFEMYENCSKHSQIVNFLKEYGFVLQGSHDNYKDLIYNLIFEKQVPNT
jgi:FkbM family methyltransferase